jgi:BlaI family penicillinase repressor
VRCAFMPKLIELTKTEWRVIKAVWDQEPCTAPQIQGKLLKETGWAYSTVRTLMDRMVVKGLLSSEKVRGATLYRSAISAQQAQRNEVLSALKQAFNGALTPMVQCLIESRNVSAAELEEIEALIKQKKRKTKGEGL